MIYETKALSLEEVDELYGTVSQAWKSKQFRPKLSFQEANDMGAAGRNMSLSEVAQEQERKRSISHMEKRVDGLAGKA